MAHLDGIVPELLRNSPALLALYILFVPFWFV